MDGISFATKLYLLRKNKEQKMRQFPKPSLKQRAMISAMTPYYFLKVVLDVAMKRF